MKGNMEKTQWLKKASKTANSLQQQLAIVHHEGYAQENAFQFGQVYAILRLVEQISITLKDIAKDHPCFLQSEQDS